MMRRLCHSILSQGASLQAGRRAGARAQSGFTLAELLAATAILIILGTMVVTVMPTSTQVVNRATYTANADVLASSVNTALADVLRYASLYTDAEGNVLFDPSTGSPYFKPASSYLDTNGNNVDMCFLSFDDGRIRLVPIVGGAMQASTPVPRSTGIYTDFNVTDFHVSFVPDASASVTAKPGVYECSYILESADGTFSKDCQFKCRPLTTETVTL